MHKIIKFYKLWQAGNQSISINKFELYKAITGADWPVQPKKAAK